MVFYFIFPCEALIRVVKKMKLFNKHRKIEHYLYSQDTQFSIKIQDVVFWKYLNSMILYSCVLRQGGIFSWSLLKRALQRQIFVAVKKAKIAAPRQIFVPAAQ